MPEGWTEANAAGFVKNNSNNTKKGTDSKLQFSCEFVLFILRIFLFYFSCTRKLFFRLISVFTSLPLHEGADCVFRIKETFAQFSPSPVFYPPPPHQSRFYPLWLVTHPIDVTSPLWHVFCLSNQKFVSSAWCWVFDQKYGVPRIYSLV